MHRREFLKTSALFGAGLIVPGRGILSAQLDSDLTAFAATELSLAIRQKHVSSVEVMQAYLRRIHRYNPAYNAIVSMVDDDTLLAQARDADQALARGEYRGWMHGMPHAVKDLVPVAGLPN